MKPCQGKGKITSLENKIEGLPSFPPCPYSMENCITLLAFACGPLHEKPHVFVTHVEILRMSDMKDIVTASAFEEMPILCPPCKLLLPFAI